MTTLIANTSAAAARAAAGRGTAGEVWRAACSQFGLSVNTNGSVLGPTASGTVDGYEVSLSVVGSKRHRNGVQTRYSIRFEAPHAPVFSVSGRTKGSRPVVHTGNPKFDSSISVTTNDPVGFAHFVTAPRRAMMSRILREWPVSTFSSEEIQFSTRGVETEGGVIAETIRHLIATADVLSRPTADELQLDEVTVLKDLFSCGLSPLDIAERFVLYYQDQQVTWTGEVLQVGSIDKAGRRVAVLVGSADGRQPESGRVVALTAIDPDREVSSGDVVTFTGNLLNLDSKKRLFRIE